MRGVEFLFVAKPAHYKYHARAGAVPYSTPHPPEGTTLRRQDHLISLTEIFR